MILIGVIIVVKVIVEKNCSLNIVEDSESIDMWKGLLIVLFFGIMLSCFVFGIVVGKFINEFIVEVGIVLLW